jgi:hypothetical protein
MKGTDFPKYILMKHTMFKSIIFSYGTKLNRNREVYMDSAERNSCKYRIYFIVLILAKL